MRIFHILTNTASDEDHQNFLALAEAFSALGFKQAAAVHQDQDLLKSLEKIDIHLSPQKFGGIFDLRTQKTIQTEIAAFRPHIINAYGLSGLDFSKDSPPDIPFIPVLNQGDITDTKEIQAAYPHTILIGHDTSEDDKKTGKVDTLTVLPPLLRAHIPTEPHEESEEKTSPLPPLPETAVVAGYTGALTEDILLDPLFQAIREIPALHILLCDKGAKARHCKNMAQKRGVHDRVHFIAENITPSTLYSAIDIALIPQKDHLPIRSILEAWQSETPVLLCNDSTNTLVKNGATGWTAPADDILELRRILKQIIASPEERKKMASSGKTLFEEQYTPQTVLGLYLKRYKDLLSR